MWTKEIEKLKKQKSRAEAKGDLQEVAQFCNVLGETYAKAGEYEEAVREHEAELSFSELLGDSLGVAVAHRKIGERLCELANFPAALTHHRMYLDGAVRCGSEVEQQRAHATIGRTYLLYAEAGLEGRVENLVTRDMLNKSRLAFQASLQLCDNLSDSDVTPKELAQMRSGLFLNLGHVFNYGKDMEKSAYYMKKAVALSSEYSLYELLFMAASSISMYYVNKDDNCSAIESLNTALDAAHKTRNKDAEVETMSQLASVYIAMKDLGKAKKMLKKAYKISKSMGQTTKESVVGKFKTVMKLSRLIEELESVSNADDEVAILHRLSMYERLGDCMADLSLFQQALIFYHHQLKCAETCGSGQDVLSAIYVSLAQTYYDLGDYNSAIIYYKKELQCCKHDLEQQCRTLLNVADAAELSGQSYEQVKQLYLDALENARLAEHTRLQIRCLKSLAVSQLNYQEKEDREWTLSELQKTKQEVGYETDEDESQPVQLHDTSDYECHQDILEELSDTDQSDTEEFPQPSLQGQARRTRALDLKRNEKGETLLHRACIEGKIKKVKSLVEMGHPVHVRDNCGWQPIHEACNHGYPDIVEVLLCHGADINDPGGEQCGGITPLHDAASAGNLHIMRLLLDRGADVHAKDHEGNTPLDSLRDWFERETDPFTQESLKEISQMENLLISTMQEKLAQQGNKQHMMSSSSLDKDNVSTILPDILSLRSRTANRLQTSKRSRSSWPSEEGFEEGETIIYPNPGLEHLTSDQSSSTATHTYRKAMENIGAWSRVKTKSQPEPSTSHKKDGSALIVDDEAITDDWLINDLPPSPKAKRKRVSMDMFVTRGIRRTNSETNSYKQGTRRFQQHKRKFQSSLKLTVPETTTENNDCSNSDDTRTMCPLSPFSMNPQEHDVKSIGASPTVTESVLETVAPSATQPQAPVDNIMRLKVKINDKIILVPFIIRDGEAGRVEELAQASAERYKQLYHMKPVLSLSTQDGALLSPDDLVSLVLTPEQLVLGTVTGWDMVPLGQMFEEACRVAHTVCHSNVRRLLGESERRCVLSLERCYLQPPQIQALCRALVSHTTLSQLHLSGTELSGQPMENLCHMLPSLTALKILNLSLCSLTSNDIGKLANCTNFPGSPLQGLEELNMSFNNLGDGSAVHVTALVKNLPALRKLNVFSTQVTLAFFHHHRMSLSSALNGSCVQELSVGHNKLGCVGVELLLMCVNPGSITSLNLAGTIPTSLNNYLPKHLMHLALQGCRLRELCLDNTSLTDEHQEEMARFIVKCSSLEKLSLNCNTKLSSSFVSHILGNAASSSSHLQHLSALSCAISTPLDTDFLKGLEDKLKHEYPLLALEITCKNLTPLDVSMLRDTWWSKWQEHGIIQTRRKTIVRLSVKELM